MIRTKPYSATYQRGHTCLPMLNLPTACVSMNLRSTCDPPSYGYAATELGSRTSRSRCSGSCWSGAAKLLLGTN